jgi:hypothetical protein
MNQLKSNAMPHMEGDKMRYSPAEVKGMKDLAKKYIDELPHESDLIISVINTIRLHQSNRRYFDEVNTKFLNHK